MDNMRELIKYFPSGRAETEIDFLTDVYVLPELYSDIITPYPRSIRILVGKKGSGKSAVAQFLRIRSESAGIPCMVIKPDDIARFENESSRALGMMKKAYHDALVYAIGVQLGSNLHGYVKDEHATLLQAAVDEGACSASGVKKVLDILMPIGKAVSGVDFTKMLPANIPKPKAVARAIESRMKDVDRLFYVCIDDTDQIASPSQTDYLERIWGLILAAQRVAENLPHVKPIVTIRSEIWSRLCQDDHGARDQVDHFRGMVRYLIPSFIDIRSILKIRLRAAGRTLAKSHINEYEPFFVGDNVTIPTSNQVRSWETFIITVSRNRPRDTIQFVNILATACIESKRDKIDSTVVENKMLVYSEQRIRDIVNENDHICSQMEAVVNSFDKREFEMNAEQVKTHLSSISGVCKVNVGGNILKHGDDDSIMVLWKLLYDSEFLTPRIADSREERGFRHIRPNEDPTFVSRQRWNEMQGVAWDIHPAYRSYLLERKAVKGREVTASLEAKKRDQSYKGDKVKTRRPSHH